MNFMWLLDSPIGIAAMTKNSFLHNLLEDINEKEYNFVKRILRSIFIVGKNFILYIINKMKIRIKE